MNSMGRSSSNVTRAVFAAVLCTLALAIAGCGGGDPTLAADPNRVELGDQEVGKRSAAQTVEITNDGRDEVTVERVAFEGPNNKQFLLSDASDCREGTTLGEDEACRLAVQFAPSGLGERSATLVIEYESEESPLEVELQGTGVGEPAVSLGTNRMQMGSVLVGKGPRTQQTTLTNTGNAPLEIDSLAVEGDTDDFKLASATTCSTDTPLPAGESCVIAVAFSPTETGSRSAAVVAEHNAPGSPSRIELTGTGTANANAKVEPSSLDFGTVEVGAKSGTKSVKLSNTGGAPLTVTGIGIGGTNAGDFTLQGGCGKGVVLGPGESCSAKIVFSPAAEGKRSATLAIVTDASSNPREIALKGTGSVSPEPA
jgi:hypothetical protein